ncbi:NADPH:quinone reductase [Rhodopirellula sallentina]|nr:NADPH:quinone reductase [Rhodopirellula sallentina]
MKAAFLTTQGPPEVIQYGDVPDPQVGEDQVLIRTHAMSVNPIDTYVRSGVIAAELPTPYFPGCDAAGIVEAVGSSVKRFQVGERVWTTNQGLVGRQGTFAEKIAVDEKWVFGLPDSVSFEDAAACALVGITAHLGLFREAQLQPGESILVIGGSGGVGSMVVQMAAATGARVIATAGSDEKAEKVRAFGAEEVILYKSQSIAEQVRQFSERGVNVVWETRREPDFATAVEVMAERGRMVLMAGRDAQPPFPVGPFYVKECSLHGFVMFKATPFEMRSAADELSRMMASGKVKANIGASFPLSEAAQAHTLQESATLDQSDRLCGKIIVTSNPSS